MHDLSTLTMDWDTLDLEDGRVLRLRIEPDDVNPFEDNPDFYGRIASTERNRETGRSQRPDGFDGNAEKLSIYNDVIWWQPPKDVKRTSEHFAGFRDFIRELASFGSHYVALEILEGEDAYHRPIVVNVASLGGIDSLDGGYLEQVVTELAAELEIS